MQVYYTLIYPHLIYCKTVWGGSCESILRQVMMLHNRILRTICNAGFRASTDPIHQSLKLLKLKEIFRYMLGAYVFKTLIRDRPCMIDFRNQTKYVARPLVLGLLKVPRVTSV